MTPKNPRIDALNQSNLDQNPEVSAVSSENRRRRDEKFMRLALKLAQKSEQIGDVPIGALIVDKQGKIVSRATNLREKELTTLGHAELVAIHRACRKLGSWRLLECTLYVTLEPCFMCAGALVQSRVGRVVYAAPDPKAGAVDSLARLGRDERLNHRFEVTGGVLEAESRELLQNFFRKRRKSFKPAP